MSIEDARRVIRSAIDARVFPATAAEMGHGANPIWSEAFGHVTFDRGSTPATRETIFDLASLTKPMATTSAAMSLVQTGALRLEARVAEFFDEWRGADREAVTVRDLLEHASGLPARLVDPPPATRREFAHEICAIKLEYTPRTQSLYSDLGFVLLGWLLAHAAGGVPLDSQFHRIVKGRTVGPGRNGPSSALHATSISTIGMEPGDALAFGVPLDARAQTAPTEPMPGDRRRGRRLVGEVHDDYASALGGVAGHAGLFGNAAGVGAFARAVLRGARAQEPQVAPFASAMVAAFTTRSTVPGSSRALGWDTMLPTSSCGERMSRRAFGHVGFTGTSLWVDPERDRYYVLLTNRVCGGGSLDDMRTVRRAFHDALADA